MVRFPIIESLYFYFIWSSVHYVLYSLHVIFGMTLPFTLDSSSRSTKPVGLVLLYEGSLPSSLPKLCYRKLNLKLPKYRTYVYSLRPTGTGISTT